MTSMDLNIPKKERISIPGFFDGKTIFITGATGFMGKVLVEKLLRSCPNIRKIYILVRPKRGKNLKERLDEMTSIPLFESLRNQDETFTRKIIPINGDTSKKNLGINEEDRKTLTEEVSIVFHAAATVRFDGYLKDAVFSNLRSTYDALELAKQMKNIEVFLHVSTAYTNTHKPVIEEKIYPAPADWRTVIDLAENMDKHELEIFTSKLIHPYPNTYTYTKQLAEHCVKDYEDVLPCLIFRPTIVTSSLTEPMSGWIDNFNGPLGLSVAYGKGLLRITYSDPNAEVDYIPVDLVIRAMIVATWEKATLRPEDRTISVYNCSTHGINRITFFDYSVKGLKIFQTVPLNNALWTLNAGLTKNKFIYYLKIFYLHIIPALLLDSLLRLTGNKPRIMKMQRKIFLGNTALEYFLTNEWSFINNKLMKLNDYILEEDRKAFSYNIRYIDWVEYMTSGAYGIREYLLKEDIKTLPAARAHARRINFIDKILKTLFSVLLMAYVVCKYDIIGSIISFLLNKCTELF